MKKWIAVILMTGMVLTAASCRLWQQNGEESSVQSTVSQSELSKLLNNEPYEKAYSFRADTLSEFVKNFKAYDIDNVLSPKASYPDKGKDPYRYQKLKGYTDMITEMQTEGIMLPFYKNKLSESDKFSMLIESETISVERHYTHHLYYEDLIIKVFCTYLIKDYFDGTKFDIEEYVIKMLERVTTRGKIEDYFKSQKGTQSQSMIQKKEIIEINNAQIESNYIIPKSSNNLNPSVSFVLQDKYYVSIEISKRGSDGKYIPINIDKEILKNISFKKVKLGELEKYADGSKASSQTPNSN